MYTPKVSVIIPAYNASNYLREAIDSALAQTYPHVEIIVVNDGSKDDGATERIALSYGDQIRYFSKENGGSSSALNMGIANMTGEWFSWLSHDDLYMPEKLEEQISYIASLGAEDAELARHIFFSASELIDASGKIIKKHSSKQTAAMARRVSTVPHNGYLVAEPTVYNFHGCSCLVHRDALKAVGCFDENLRLLNDIDLWYRLYTAGYQVHYIAKPLVQGRIHAEQISRSIGFSYHNDEQDMFWGRSLKWLMEHHPEEGVLFSRYGRNAFLKTRNTEGDQAYEYLISRKPSQKLKLLILARVYKSRAAVRKLAKGAYLKLKA